jgi:apoptosis-inducing factor 2
MGFLIGKKAGTGHVGSLKIPSFIIVRVRKTLFLERLGRTVDGSLF